MNQKERLQQAITDLEAQRAVLGDETVDAAIDGLRQKIAALGSDGHQPDSAMDGERKIVTVMFADIAGFTSMAEKMDPEVVRDMMNACFEALVPIVQKYGGTVDKFIGDEIRALFGAPVAHENDPERALRAALDMMIELVRFNTDRNTDLGLHFGINTGLVLAGGIGAGNRQEYSVMGDAANLAARLEEASERGQIFVGPDTYRLTAPLFEFTALEPLKLKGKADPVPVYQLLSTKAQPGNIRGLESHGILSPLVGRHAEASVFSSKLAHLLEGQGSIVAVIGEAGLGKSRLVAEIRRQVPAGELTWLEGRSLSFGQKVGYWPFQEIVRGFVHITEEDSEAVAWNKLAQRVQALFPDQVAEILPYLASLLALNVRPEYEERVKYLDGEAMGRQIFLTMRRFFVRLAQDQPLILLFEDIHWADEASVALLEHVLPLVEREPLLIGLVSRPDPDCPAARIQALAAQEYADYYTAIRLAPLSESDSTQLVHNLLAIKNLPPQVQRLILSKSEGNPFFVEEVIRTLIDMQALSRDADTGEWRATSYIEHVTIPDTIHGVVMARIDRLEEDVKHVVRRAAVIGRAFLYRILHALSQADAELDEHLAELQHLEMIREKQRTPELEYIFKHALAHEATYHSILKQRRQELHVQVGQCIETLFADRLEEFYGLLAYHYAQAEDWEKAQTYLFKAGDQAGHLAADAEALDYYQKAMAAYEKVFGDQWEPLERAKLERKLGEVLFRRGEHEQAIARLHRALKHLGLVFPQSGWPLYLAILWQLIRQVIHRLLPKSFIAPFAVPDTPVDEEVSHIYELLARMDYFVDQNRFLLDAVWLLNLDEQRNFEVGIVRGNAGLGIICSAMGLLKIAESYHKRAVQLAEHIQNPTSIGLAYAGLHLYEWYLGKVDKVSLKHGQKALNVYWEIGNLREWGTTMPILHEQYLWRGEFEHSLEVCERLIEVGNDMADNQLLGWGVLGLGRIKQRSGLIDEALAHLQEVLETFQAIPDYPGNVDTLGEMGFCYLRQNKPQEARLVLEEAHRIIKEQNVMGSQILVAYSGLAEAYLILAEQANDVQEEKRWTKKAKRACRTALKQSKRCRPWLPHSLRMQGRFQCLTGKEKAAQKWWQRSRDIAQHMGMRYELGMTHLEIGKYLQDQVHLEQAEAIFSDIGAKLDLARARELLSEEKNKI